MHPCILIRQTHFLQLYLFKFDAYLGRLSWSIEKKVCSIS